MKFTPFCIRLPGSLVLAALTLASFPLAQADDAPQASPMIQVGAGSDAPQKVTIVMGPAALQKALAGHLAGEESWVSIDLDAGLFSGIRADVLAYHNENLAVAVEGFYGATLLSPGYGGGVRVQFRVVGGEKNAMLISPGVDVLVSPADNSLFGHEGTFVYALANADIEWVHEFAPHFSFELGVRLGAGVRLWDGAYQNWCPDVDVFTGFRF
jgi:hypothetical protein